MKKIISKEVLENFIQKKDKLLYLVPIFVAVLILTAYLLGLRPGRELHLETQLREKENELTQLTKIESLIRANVRLNSGYYVFNTVRNIFSVAQMMQPGSDDFQIQGEYQSAQKQETGTIPQFDGSLSGCIAKIDDNLARKIITVTFANDCNRISDILYQVSKCQEVYGEGCVIVSIYPLVLDIYYY